MWTHASLSDLQGAFGPDDFRQMFCFTLVRNPWDRVVSYYHWLRDQKFNHPAVQIAKAQSFEDFLFHRLTQSSLIAWPYGRYMRDVDGTEHGHFLRLEHLEDDIEPLVQHIGFAPDLPHANQSQRAGYHSYYTDETQALVGRLCAEDIARFGYQF